MSKLLNSNQTIIFAKNKQPIKSVNVVFLSFHAVAPGMHFVQHGMFYYKNLTPAAGTDRNI
jgi:hypothetical protein